MTAPATDRRPSEPSAAGLGYALLAYGSWGLFPLFWKQLEHIPSLEVVAHRVVWSCAAYVVLVLALRRGRELSRALVSWATLRAIVPSSLLIATNWLAFIYTVSTGRVLHASLGYFLNPLFSILLGMVFLGERLRLAQWLAVALACVGVAFMASLAEGIPWMGLVLAATFGGYGLVRKIAPVDGLIGATMESVLLLPVGALWLVMLALDGTGAMGRLGTGIDLMLVSAGIITAAPLVWFANAARRLTLRTLGFLQYLAPTGQFALAVLVFGETLTEVHWRGFACIWAGVAVFSVESWWAARRPGARS